MREKLNKKIFNRIYELEKKYSYIDIEKNKEKINWLIEFLENYFGYNIRDRINFSEYDYKNIEDPERAVFEKLTINELKNITYDITKNKKTTI